MWNIQNYMFQLLKYIIVYNIHSALFEAKKDGKMWNFGGNFKEFI